MIKAKLFKFIDITQSDENERRVTVEIKYAQTLEEQKEAEEAKDDQPTIEEQGLIRVYDLKQTDKIICQVANDRIIEREELEILQDN